MLVVNLNVNQSDAAVRTFVCPCRYSNLMDFNAAPSSSKPPQCSSKISLPWSSHGGCRQ